MSGEDRDVPHPREPEEAPGRPVWRLIQDGAHGAAWNMAVDEAVLDAVALGLAPPTLRLYRWLHPAVSIGRHQDVERDIDVGTCVEMGIELVRRPTGGRAILHGGDQTLSIITPAVLLGPEAGSVVGSYRLLSAALSEGLAQFGIALEEGHSAALRGPGGDCFAVRTRADLVTAAGDKLVGSAQRRRGGVLLQQTSIRHLPVSVAPDQVFRGPVAEPSYPLATVGETALQSAVVDGLSGALGIRFTPGPLCGWEEERACVLQAGLQQAGEHG